MLTVRHPVTSQLINYMSWFDFELTSPARLRVDDAGVFIGIPLSDGDQLNFQLDKFAIYCPSTPCFDHFIPVIEVKSIKGSTYLVDIHQLFFVDLGKVMNRKLRSKEMYEASPETRERLIYDELASLIDFPQVSYRKQRSNFATKAMTLEEGLPQTVIWSN